MPTTPMYRVTQVATGVPGAPYYMTAYFDASEELPQTVASAWAALVRTDSGDRYGGLNHEAITEVDIVDPATGQSTGALAVNVPAGNIGNNGQPLPLSNQLLLKWGSSSYINGRRVQGRTNIPGLIEALSDSGRPNAVALGNWNTALGAFALAHGGSHVIYSRASGQWSNVTTQGVWSEWAILRSRRD